MLGSSLITEWVETLYIFSLRTKAYTRLEPNHQID